MIVGKSHDLCRHGQKLSRVIYNMGYNCGLKIGTCELAVRDYEKSCVNVMSHSMSKIM